MPSSVKLNLEATQIWGQSDDFGKFCSHYVAHGPIQTIVVHSAYREPKTTWWELIVLSEPILQALWPVPPLGSTVLPDGELLISQSPCAADVVVAFLASPTPAAGSSTYHARRSNANLKVKRPLAAAKFKT